MGKQNKGVPPLPSGYSIAEEEVDTVSQPPLPGGYSFDEDIVKKKDSPVESASTFVGSSLGSNPFLGSRIRNSNPLMDPRIPVSQSPSVRFPYDDPTRDYYAESSRAVKNEIAERKSAPAEAANSIPEDADDQSYAGEVAESLFERGLARLYSMVSKTPSFLYRVASVPQNALADVTGWESVRPMTPEQISEQTGIRNVVADYYDGVAQKSQEKISKKYNDTITGYLEKGDWANAALLTGNQIAESIPVTLGIALTRGAGASSGATVIGGGAVFGAGKYSEIADSPLPENVKVFNAALTGLTEGVFENLGTGKIIDAGIDIIKNQGKEAGFEFAKNSFTQIFKQALKKSYILNSTITEGLEEAGTTFAQNLIDRETGVNPNVKLTDGMLDSFIVGAGSGTAMSAPISAYSKITNPSKKINIQTDIASNEALAQDLNNPEVPDNLKGNLLNQYMANNERINNEIEQNDERLRKLTPEDAQLAESLLVQINQVDEIINNDKISAEAKVSAVKNQEDMYATLNSIISGEPTPLDAETQIERQNRLDREVAQFQANFPERPIDPLDDLPPSVVRTFDRVDNDVPTDIVAINEASDWMYNKYKQLTAMKEADKRTLTLDQIESVQEQLSEDIALLENFKAKYYGDGETQTEQPAGTAAEETAAAVQTEQPAAELRTETAVDQSPVKAPESNGRTTGSTNPGIIRTATFNNPELQQQDFQIQELDNGTFDVVDEDGAVQNYTRQDIQDVIGFNPDTRVDSNNNLSDENLQKISDAFSKRFGIETKVITPEEAENILKGKNSKDVFFQILDEVDVFNSQDVNSAKSFIDKVFNTVENEKDAKTAFRKLAVKYHPDKMGSEEIMKHLNDINEKYKTGKLTKPIQANQPTSGRPASKSYSSYDQFSEDIFEQFRRDTESASGRADNYQNTYKDRAQANEERYGSAQQRQSAPKAPPTPEPKVKKDGIFDNIKEYFRKKTPAELRQKAKDLSANAESERKASEKKAIADRDSALANIKAKYKNNYGEQATQNKIIFDRYYDKMASIRERYNTQNERANYINKQSYNLQVNESKVAGFYDKATKTAFLIKGAANETTAIHEIFSHPFIELVESENPELFKNLLNEAKSDAQVLEYVNSNYADASELTKDHEYIAAAIDLEAKGVLKNKSLIDHIKEFWKEVKTKLSSLFGREIKDLTADLKISDIVDFVIRSNEKLDLGKARNEANFTNQFEDRLSSAATPEEVAAIYDEEVTNISDTGNPEAAIAAYIPTTTQEEFARYNDANNMTSQIRLQYTPVGEQAKGIPLDTQAQEINNQYFNGQEVVSAEDIANFMVSYPNGPASFTSISGNETLNRINNRYRELTGKNLRKDTARRLAEKYKKSVAEAEAAVEQIESIEEKISGIIEQDIKFTDGFTTPQEIAKGWNDNLNQYSEDPSNQFNFWYPAFQGNEITTEQFDNIQNLINERTTDQGGSDTGIEGPLSGSDTTEQTTGSTEGGNRSGEPTIAERIRSLKSKPGQLYGGIQGVGTAVWDGALETLATAIETGQSVLNAIQRAVDYIKANSSVQDEELIEAALRDDLHLMGIDTATPVEPTRDPGESVHEYALRLAQWRQYNMPNLNNSGQLNNNNPQINVFNNNWVLPEEKAKDKLVRKNVDFLNRLQKAEEAIRDAGGVISPQESAHTQFQLLGSKAAKKIDDVMADVVISPNKSQKSLFERVKASGLSINDLGLFTYAQHAPERNAYIAELRQQNYDAEEQRLINSRKEKVAQGLSPAYENNRLSALRNGRLPGFELMPDEGSGMSNEVSEKILDEYREEGKYDQLVDFAEEYRNKVTRVDLAQQYQSGLISDAEYENITKRYKQYVPLQIEEYVNKSWASTIKNIKSTRKVAMRSKGSNRTFNERVNPVLFGLVQFEKSLIESSKNDWLTGLKNMVIAHPNDDVWEIKKPQYVPEYNKNGSFRKMNEVTPKEIIDQSVKAFDNGKPYYIQLKDEILRRAVKQEGFIKDKNVLAVLSSLNTVNSWLRGVNTLYNPNFILENFIRDPQEAAFQLSGKGKGIKRQFFKNIPGALKGIFNHQRGDRTSEWAQTYEEYLNAGAKISFTQYQSDIEKLRDVAKNLERIGEKGGSVTRVMRNVKDWFENVSSVLELTTRVAAFKAAKDAGMDVSEAANLSRNATVDFNKKGELTSLTNAMYLFANAGTQGGFNMVKKVVTSPQGRKFMGAYVMAGFTAALINTLAGSDDDDKDPNAIKNNYWALPEYQRASSFILKNPVGDGFFKIPVGRALASPFFAGAELLGTIMGKVKPSDALKDVGLSIINTHNPLGGSQDLLQVVAPTVIDPLVQMSTNKNSFGSPIYKEQKYGTKSPDSQSYFKNTNEFSIAFSNWLNEATGGNKVESGAIDISPNRIDWAAQTVGGGAANFVKNNILGFATDIHKSDMDAAVKNAPILSRFYTTSKPVSNLSTVFQTLEKSGTEKLGADDKAEFMRALKDARKAKEIKPADFSRYRTIYLKNQKRIDMARKHPDWTEEKLDRFFKRD